MRTTGGRKPHERRTAILLLVLVGGGFLAAQLTLFSTHRAPGWDESVYLSQVTPHVPAVFFAPSRARGITFLVAPVAATGASLAAVRVFLAVLSSLALGAALLPWVAVIGLAAPLAAVLVGFSWLGLFYGSEAMPNLWAALAGVAAVGVIGPALAGDRRRWRLPLAASLLLAMALIRPPDSLPVAMAIVAGAIVARRSVLRTFLFLGSALALGWAPWIAEMAARFGSIGRAFSQGGSTGHVGLGNAGHLAAQHLALTDGPLIGPDHGGIPAEGVAWWAALVALTVISLVILRRTAASSPLRVAAIGGTLAAAEYLAVVQGLAPRFLLPAYALLAVTAAAGIGALLRSSGGLRAIGVTGLALVAAWIAWQVPTADRVERNAARAEASTRLVGLTLRDLAGGAPCAFASSDSYPQIQYASRCRGRPIREGAVPEKEAIGRGVDGPVYLAERAPSPTPARWRRVTRVVGPDGRPWIIFEPASR